MKPGPLTIRPAAVSEAKILTRIAVESKAYWGYAPEQMDRWRDDLTISAELIGTSHAHVAEIDDEPVGFYALAPAEDAWDLTHMWVLPAHMGRGIGRALLKHASALAARYGASSIAIDADPFAEVFYLACGAVRVGAVDAPIEGQPLRQRPQLVLGLLDK